MLWAAIAGLRPKHQKTWLRLCRPAFCPLGVRFLSEGTERSACGADRSSQSNIKGIAWNSISSPSYLYMTMC